MSDAMSMDSSSRDEKKSFIRCVENSSAHLEALFEVLSGPSQNRPPRQPSELPPSFNEEPKKPDELRNNTLGPSVHVPGQVTKHMRHNRIHSLPGELPSVYQRHLGSGDFQAPLPAGWEMAKTPEGHCYYINHNERRTQWEDPRITMMGLSNRPSELGPMPVPQLSQSPFGQQMVAPGHHPQQHGFPPFYQHPRHLGHNQSLDTTGNMSPIGSDGDHLGVHVHPGYGHMYTHSYSGPMHMHMRSHPAQMPGHATAHHMGAAHGPNSAKRMYDFDQKLPVSLQGDPYLSTSSHVRDASRDSGLGYPVTPYQDQSVMEIDDGFDGGQMAAPGQHVAPGHALQQQQTPMMQNPEDLDLHDFGNSSMLSDLNQESHLFSSNAAWV